MIAIGECMVELAAAGADDRLFRLGFAGDTFNTALYLARLGRSVGYATALGDDPYSDRAAALMRAEGIDTGLVRRVPGRLPGLYLIENDPAGERRFAYWRDMAPVRDLFAAPPEEWRTAFATARWLFLSGITLAIVGAAGRRVLLGWLAEARRAGARVALDLNFRPALWPDVAAAARALDEASAQVDLLSFSDEEAAALWPDRGDIAAGLAARGIEVVERRPGPAAIIRAEGERQLVAAAQVTAVDATGAGDSFNAGYLAARMAGAAPAAAAVAAHALAATVVRHRGAIVPRSAMPASARREGN